MRRIAVVVAFVALAGAVPIVWATSPPPPPCPGPPQPPEGANFHGSLTGEMLGDDQIVDFDMTAFGRGYWLTSESGNVFAFGDAQWFGSMAPELLGDQQVIDLFPLHPPDLGRGCDSPYTGYLVITDHGNVYPFGQAAACGSIAVEDLGGQRVVAFDPSWSQSDLISGVPWFNPGPALGRCGYRLLTDRGNVYAFGVAGFCGSVPGGTAEGDDAIAIAEARGSCGYRIFTERGNVYAFGGGEPLGSIDPGDLGDQRVVDVFSDEWNEPDDSPRSAPGYVLFTEAGNTYAFGSLLWPGSLSFADEPIVTVDFDESWNGLGYRLYGSRGGVFAISCADFDGSASGLLAPGEQVVATQTYLNEAGYYVVTDRGHVYAFEDFNRGTCYRFPGED